MALNMLMPIVAALTVNYSTVVEKMAHRPETWFHLIGGNVSKAGLTADLEAIKAAGFGGIQFFHGETDEIWPGVDEPVRCMSAKWEDVGGVLRFAVDGRPMPAMAVLPSPAGKPDVAAATVLVERMKLGETRVWRIGEVR